MLTRFAQGQERLEHSPTRSRLLSWVSTGDGTALGGGGSGSGNIGSGVDEQGHTAPWGPESSTDSGRATLDTLLDMLTTRLDAALDLFLTTSSKVQELIDVIESDYDRAAAGDVQSLATSDRLRKSQLADAESLTELNERITHAVTVYSLLAGLSSQDRDDARRATTDIELAEQRAAAAEAECEQVPNPNPNPNPNLNPNPNPHPNPNR